MSERMLVQYDPTSPEHEILLMQWWAHLLETGELSTVFGPNYQRLSEVFAAFRSSPLFFTADAHGFSRAFWFDDALAGAFFSIWLRQDQRQSKASLEAISEALGVGFHALKYRAVIVVTKDPTIARLHQRYGFTKLGNVPGLYFGETALISVMTDDTFDQIATPQEATA